MSEAQWMSASTQARVRASVEAIERVSGVEVVVTVARASLVDRAAEWLVGAVFALLALAVYFFYPEPLFDDVALALVVASYALGALLAAAWPGLRRVVTPKRQRDVAVRRAARAHFVDCALATTRARTGVLVYVSLLERRVEIVADVGVATPSLGSRWDDAQSTLERAAALGVDPFVEALSGLAPLFAELVPRAADDVNELLDGMVSA